MNSSRRKFIHSLAAGTGAAISYPLANSGPADGAAPSTGSIPVFNVRDFGAKGGGQTDDTRAIQQALDLARDHETETVYVPSGTYNISEILIIYQNTTLKLDKHARIVRKSDINAMLLNGTEDVKGYEGQSNITVEGGTWDAAAREFPSNVTPLGFGHGRNITIRNLTVRDVYNWHHVEINAIDGATIQDCRFEEMTLTRAATEMLQIDLMGSFGMFPWFGESDNTTCRNVLINRCTFINGDTAGIGTHSTREDARHDFITITNCEFINLKREGIVAQNWQDVTIENNLFRNCGQAVFIEVKTNTDCSGITITNNKVLDMILADRPKGIHVRSEQTGSQISNIRIAGNYLSGIKGDGITVEYCDHALIQSNTVKDCSGTGIWSYYSHNASLVGNTAYDNAAGPDTEHQDLRINSAEAKKPTIHHIVSSNNVGSGQVERVDQCLVSNNIFKKAFSKGTNSVEVVETNNYIGGNFAHGPLQD